VKPVLREEIPDHVTYSEGRDAIRASAMRAKDLRRVHAGQHLTFLFENHETVRYQVLEMVRAEQLVREADIRHELETYNALLGGPGDLGCTLLIEIEDEQLRPALLRAWRDLPGRVFLVLADGTQVGARWDGAQMDGDRLSSVQFLRFPVESRPPVSIRVTHPALAVETPLSPETGRALAQDLGPLA
jgi:hypothetical protein